MGVGADNTDAVFKLSAGDAGDKEKTGLVQARAEAEPGAEATEPAREDRGTWARRLEFVLASVGYAVGLGNVWRFPYLCYRSGGGAFLVPYMIMLFLCGIPLLFIEFAIGQYTRLGPVLAFAKICPLLKVFISSKTEIVYPVKTFGSLT